MADNKKSIIVYADWIELFETLEDVEAGKLIKHFFRYVNDKKPIAPDRITELSFIPIKQSLKRDLIKWEQTLEGRSKAGKASAEKRRLDKLAEQHPTNPTSVESVEKNPTNPTDSVNVSVNVSDINNNIYSEVEFLERWKKARLYYDKQPTNITKLTGFEKIAFKNICNSYTPKEIDNAIAGLFQQKTYPATRLRPSHFLELEHFEKYLTCWVTKEKLYDTKNKRPIERI